jgi:small subunit ribosomal protein S20
MPIIKSAVKRMHQTARRRARNQGTKRSLRAEMKAFSAAVDAKDGKKAAEQLKKVQSRLDIAGKKNLLKKNAAARKMSQLSETVKSLGAKPASGTKRQSAAGGKPATKPAKPAAKAPAKKPAAKAAPKKTPVKKPASKK